MQLNLFVVLASVTAVLAAPMPQTAASAVQESTAQALQDLIGGATSVPAAFLSGNAKAISDASARLAGAVAQFPTSFLNDFTKAMAAAQKGAAASLPVAPVVAVPAHGP